MLEDNSPAPDQPEDLLDQRVEENNDLFEATCQQVCVLLLIGQPNNLNSKQLSGLI